MASPLDAAKLSKEEQAELVRQVQHYFGEEHGLELGDLGASFAIEFFAKLIGPILYNLAVEDARAVVAARAQTMDEEIFGLTRPFNPREQS